MVFRIRNIVLLTSLFGILIIYPLINGSNILFISIVLLTCIGFCIFDSFFNRFYLFFLFQVLVSEIYIVMLVRSVILKSSENSWRINYNIESLSITSLKYMLLSLVIFGIIQILGSSGNKQDKELLLFPKAKHENVIVVLLNIFSILFLAIFTVRADVLSLRDYADTIDTTFMPIFIMIFCVYLLMFGRLLKPKLNYSLIEILTTLVLLLYTGIFLILVLKGYRFLLVQISTLIFLITLLRQKVLMKKTILLVGGLGIGFYFLLISIKTRYLGISDKSSLLFGHERNLFYSLNAIISNQTDSSVNTYASTFLNILPKVLTNSDHLNVSGIIMQYVNASSYSETGVTVGAFYLVEAYLSFGFWGVPLVSIILAITMLLLEKNNNNKTNPLYLYFYAFVGSQMFNIVYYGSLNYIKQIIYFTVMILLLRLAKVIVFDKSNKTTL